VHSLKLVTAGLFRAAETDNLGEEEEKEVVVEDLQSGSKRSDCPALGRCCCC